MIPVVFVSGPYRAKKIFGIQRNITRARHAAEHIAAMGAMPVTPHLNTAWMDGIQEDDFWLDGYVELMQRCDAVYMIPGWAGSEGAELEFKEATSLGLPVFLEFESLEMWVRNEAGREAAVVCKHAV